MYQSRVVSVPYRGATFLNRAKVWFVTVAVKVVSVPYRGATFLNNLRSIANYYMPVSVPYRGATFLNRLMKFTNSVKESFPSPIGELHFSIDSVKHERKTLVRVSVPYRGATFLNAFKGIERIRERKSFRPLSGSYISQYHPRNPMSCLGRIGGLRGKSNFIEIQPFWKVKSSHKSSI